jgi:hypothetical protein
MIDLTLTIKKALTINYRWADDEFYLVYDLLENKGYGISFWEGEENWATLNIQGHWLGYLWNKYRLLLINKEYEGEIVKILEGSFPSLYSVENATDKIYTLDYKELSGLIVRFLR